MQAVKLILVGDSGVGKTCLSTSYVSNTFPDKYESTVFDHFCTNVVVDGKPINLGLWDTAGDEAYDKLRPLSYQQTDICFICFSVDNEASLENIEQKWIPEIRHHTPDTPALVVACKTDLRSGLGQSAVTYDQGCNVAKKYGMKYCEVSALTQEGLKACFDDAMRTVLQS